MCVTPASTVDSKSPRSLSRRLKNWRNSMIQLHPDYLIFQTSEGELIPCSAESVTIELMGDASSLLDQETVRQATAAVVHYFKHDLGQDTVSVGEFSKALERVLNAFGFNVTTSTNEEYQVSMVVADLHELAK